MQTLWQDLRYGARMLLRNPNFTLIAAVTLALAIGAHAVTIKQTPAAQPPTRTVKGRVLTSTQSPAVRLEFDPAFQYAGGHSFILYNVAHAEQHFFVEADKEKRIKRLYWVQFEGYLPDNSHKYNYKVTKTVTLGGLEFIADAYARNTKANPGRPDSDGSRARAFLESKGYRMASDETLSQRLVHLTDESKRNELMMIYLEDLSSLKLTASDLAPGGRAAAQWEEIANALLQRATQRVKVLR
ncbi:MAG: hypothetical protein ACREEM_30145 [Blastocatellia bacterium]